MKQSTLVLRIALHLPRIPASTTVLATRGRIAPVVPMIVPGLQEVNPAAGTVAVRTPVMQRCAGTTVFCHRSLIAAMALQILKRSVTTEEKPHIVMQIVRCQSVEIHISIQVPARSVMMVGRPRPVTATVPCRNAVTDCKIFPLVKSVTTATPYPGTAAATCARSNHRPILIAATVW